MALIACIKYVYGQDIRARARARAPGIVSVACV